MKEVRKSKKMKEIYGRKEVQWVMMLLLPLVVVGGYYQPMLGFVVAAMMMIGMTMAFLRGRYYCGWFCAMGAFHERILSRLSRNNAMLPLFKKTWFRWLMFALMMGLLGSRLFMAGGDPGRTADAFRVMWVVSTGLAIAFGLYFKPRTWCSFCPMGLMQALLSRKKYLLTVNSDKCKECGLCEKSCSIETNPGAHKEAGFVPSVECMRCSNCVANCPTQALSFQDRKDIVFTVVDGRKKADADAGSDEDKDVGMKEAA
ncbi:MAG: 4Fe-4S binding protein [Desulfobulbaceae bacterium]|nr:4Fe-4S binding protein [Desulfobulbaceae bacterium]